MNTATAHPDTDATAHQAAGSPPLAGARDAAIVTIRPGAVFKVLLGAIAALFMLGIVAPLIYHTTRSDGVKHLMLRFDPGQEGNLPTWFASTLLLLAAGSVFAVALVRRHAGERRHLTRWFLLAGLIFVAAVDEASGFHELLTPATKRFVETTGFLDNAWMIPVAGLLVVLGIVYLPWLMALPRRTAVLVVLAGAIFIGGAMACEGVGSVVLERQGPGGLPYAMVVATEEAFENLGSAMFLLAMLGHLAWMRARLTVELAPARRAGA